MTTDLNETMRRNVLEVFGEPDPERRAAVVAELYVDDPSLYDPEGELHGRPALLQRVSDLQASAPGLTFRLTSEPRAVHDLAIVTWELVDPAAPPGTPPAVTGTDVGRFEGDRLATLWTFLP